MFTESVRMAIAWNAKIAAKIIGQNSQKEKKNEITGEKKFRGRSWDFSGSKEK